MPRTTITPDRRKKLSKAGKACVRKHSKAFMKKIGAKGGTEHGRRYREMQKALEKQNAA